MTSKKKCIDIEVVIAEIKKDVAHIIDMLSGNGGLVARVRGLEDSENTREGFNKGIRVVLGLIGVGTIVNLILLSVKILGH